MKAAKKAPPKADYNLVNLYITSEATENAKGAELHADHCAELLGLLEDVRRRAAAVRAELHRVLVQELNYFGG